MRRWEFNIVTVGPLPVWLAFILITGCTVLPARPTGAPSHALDDTRATTLGRIASAASGGDNQRSAVCIQDRGEEAFVSRIALIDLAERSIDLQTYCLTSDRVGRLLCARLLRTADRGVRVRLLVDDLDTGGRDLNIALFDAHPNIEVRLYNPFRVRFFTRLGRPLEMLVSLDRLDHRMHNKTFVVDNQAAVIGGRNIADEYFGVNHEYNYRDFDLLALGRAAAQVSECFDAYWANDRSYPVRDVSPRDITPHQLQEARDKLNAFVVSQRGAFPYWLPDSREEALKYITDTVHPAVVATTRVLYDDPGKGDIDAVQPSQIREVLSLSPPRNELLVMNPYFLPQEKLIAALVGTQKRGVKVRILTNSLASTDVVAVHAAYSKSRPELLTAGVALSELRADAEARGNLNAPNCRDARLSLHAKVLVIDQQRVFVGSMNLDPRSHRLNTEDGLLVESPELARQVEARLNVEFEPTNCWQLSLKNGDLAWTTTRAGAIQSTCSDPDASFWRKSAWRFFKILPIEGEL